MLLLFVGWIGAQSFRIPVMSLAEIKPGMTGVGKTIFYGDQIEEFGVQVLDIMKNVYPQRDIIIVRLTGEKAEKMGVVGGMSGSPVYIDGKLVGALSMRLGDFQKEPIAGVTPFEDMVKSAEKEHQRQGGAVSTTSQMNSYLQGLLINTDDSFWRELLKKYHPFLPTTTSGFRPIESPLTFAGFSDQAVSMAYPVLSSFGFQPFAGGTWGDAPFQASTRLEPGNAISQVFVSGDLTIDATGTLTAIDNNSILAFGHFIFNLGEINLPLGRSHILATLPSLLDAKKIAVTTEIIGVARQDRLCGIYGELGVKPLWIPVRVRLQEDGTANHIFHFQIATDVAVNHIMPFFLRTALFQALVAGRLAAQPCAITLKGKISLDDGQSLSFSDFFAYEQQLGFFGAGSEAAEAADFVAKIVGLLMVNDFSPPAVKDIDLEAKVTNGEHLARVEALQLNRLEATPGDSLVAIIKLRCSDGTLRQYRHTVRLPKNLRSKYVTILAGGSAAIIQNELLKNPDKYRPASFRQLVKIIENRRRSNALYIQMCEAAAGLSIAGEELNALPPSIMSIMDHRSSTKPLREHLLVEDALPMAEKIIGLQKINLRIIQPSSAKQKDEAQPLFNSDW